MLEGDPAPHHPPYNWMLGRRSDRPPLTLVQGLGLGALVPFLVKGPLWPIVPAATASAAAR